MLFLFKFLYLGVFLFEDIISATNVPKTDILTSPTKKNDTNLKKNENDLLSKSKSKDGKKTMFDNDCYKDSKEIINLKKNEKNPLSKSKPKDGKKTKSKKDCDKDSKEKEPEKTTRRLWDCSDNTNYSLYSKKYLCKEKEKPKDDRVVIEDFDYDLCRKNKCEEDDGCGCKCECVIDSHDPTKTKDEING